MAARRQAQQKGDRDSGPAVAVGLEAFEVVQRGSAVLIDSPEAKDERALAAGLRFTV